MKNTLKNKLRYNLHGYMVEYNQKNQLWIWSKWDYADDLGVKKVVRHSGLVQFKKIFPSVFEGKHEDIEVHSAAQLESALNERGVDYIFLFQGQSRMDERFDSIEEAERYYRLENCPHWNLTNYWFNYDKKIDSWGMYDAFTGALQFTPQSILQKRSRSPYVTNKKSARVHAVRGGFYKECGSTVH